MAKRSGTRLTRRAGQVAETAGKTLRSYSVGAVPIINHLLRRMNVEAILQQHLPAETPRTKVPAATGLLLLVRNVLICREPIYGVADWASRYAPDLLRLSPAQLAALNDDRLGRVLGVFFSVIGPQLILAVAQYAIREFRLRLDELHNDSTSISFYGNYPEAATEGLRRGRPTHAITWGFSKDHRPDLKQLLYILTVTEDGGVPVYFTSASGNVSDDRTHIPTWDLLCQLVGSPDFLYVADCKLASVANLDYLARRGGRFVTVLPATRREDAEFRRRLNESSAALLWQHVYDVTRPTLDGQEEIIDQFSVWSEEQSTSEGYRLLWYRSTRKVELDRASRLQRTERALTELATLRQRLEGPRSRFHDRAKVAEAVAEILKVRGVERWVKVTVSEEETAEYRQATRGRPGKGTQYVREVQTRFRLSAEVDATQLEWETLGDGVFPLLTNQREMNEETLLRAYKRQPLIEKRFSQFKTDFAVAPVYLKDVTRIQGLLGVYFLALLVQTLLERELRQAMQREGVTHLPLYGEDRDCRRPTARKVFDAFEPIQRHVLTLPDGSQEIMTTQLSPLQRQILKLLRIPAATYGR